MANDDLVPEKKKPDDEEDEERRTRYAPGEAETARPLPAVGAADGTMGGMAPFAPVETRPQPGTSAYSRERIGELESELAPKTGGTTLQKIGRGFKTAGEVAGQLFAPTIMATLPSTRFHKELELGAERRRLGQELTRESEEPLRAAQTEEALGKGEEARAQAAHLGAKKYLEGPTNIWTETDEQNRPVGMWQRTQTGTAAPQWERVPMPGERMPTTGAAPPTAAEGMPTIPAQPTAAPPMGAPPLAAAPERRGYFGEKPPEGAKGVRLTDAQLKQHNDSAEAIWSGSNPGKPMPDAFRLKNGATVQDQENARQELENATRGSATEAQREFTQEQARERAGREKEAAAERQEKANAEWVRAVDNNGKVHVMTRGAYNRDKANYHADPGDVPKTEYDKITDHNTVLNEMQARMNATVESANRFNWNDTGQKNVVIQMMDTVDKNYADNLIGIPVMRFVADNLKKLGAAGATPETREYIIDILSLRESMLGMPKEITGGSRQLQSSIDALYSTLPSGVTPDRPWAMQQLRTAQQIMDRLRGSRVPIVEGMTQIQKDPMLYRHHGVDPKTKREIFSDDMKTWTDIDGNPVR
jgi:hypothetical protein